METMPCLPSEWSGWIITELIGAGSYGTVYKAEKRDEAGICMEAAVKIIRIPAGEAELTALSHEYPDREDQIRYCDNLVQGMLTEIRTMGLLRTNPHVVRMEEYHVEHEEGALFWTIYIRMELLTPLPDYLVTHEPDTEELIKLGADICRALETCQSEGILHRDIKPENILTDGRGSFKLGDFGVARQIGALTESLSVRGTFTYMAPEVYHGEPYDILADEYSLGIVLYRLFNKNRDPFTDPDASMVYYRDREESLKRRMKGESLPDPVSAPEDVARVIRKACAFRKEDRYQDIAAFRRDLEACLRTEGKESGIREDKDRTGQEETVKIHGKSWKKIVPVLAAVLVVAGIGGRTLLQRGGSTWTVPETESVTEHTEAVTEEAPAETEAITRAAEAITETVEEETEAATETEAVTETESDPKGDAAEKTDGSFSSSIYTGENMHSIAEKFRQDLGLRP